MSNARPSDCMYAPESLCTHLLSHTLDLVDVECDTDEIPPRDAVERVASRANLAVDLVSAANAESGAKRGASSEDASVQVPISIGLLRLPDSRSVVKGVEHAVVAPRVLGSVKTLVDHVGLEVVNEGDRAVLVGVPAQRTGSECRCAGQGSPGSPEGLSRRRGSLSRGRASLYAPKKGSRMGSAYGLSDLQCGGEKQLKIASSRH